jgi:hypothetical protein
LRKIKTKLNGQAEIAQNDGVGESYIFKKVYKKTQVDLYVTT